MSTSETPARRPWTAEERDRHFRAMMEISERAAALVPKDTTTPREWQDELYHPDTGMPSPDGDFSLTDAKRAL